MPSASSPRGQYGSGYLDLRAQSRFPSERVERQTLGRYQTLDALVTDLSSVTPDMKPGQVHDLIVRILHDLAEDKATWMVHSIRKRQLYGINQLGAWTAEGAIAQIDEVVPALMKRLLPRSNPRQQIHSRFFQVFQQRVPDGVEDAQRSAERWSDAREHWYREVAFLQFPQPDVLLEQARPRPTVHWSLEGHRSPSPLSEMSLSPCSPVPPGS